MAFSPLSRLARSERYYRLKAFVFTTTFSEIYRTQEVLPTIATLGPSSAMKGLIQELKSTNRSGGTWTIIIPRLAEQYFLATLKNMENGVLSQARGTVRLIDSMGNTAIEQEVQRVSNGVFTVNHGIGIRGIPGTS